MLIVDDPPARYRQAEIKAPIALFVPAEMIRHLEIRHRPARLQRLAEIRRKALLRPLLPPLGDDVFEPGVSAIAAVAPIAMQPHDRGCRVEEIVGSDEGDRRREPRVSLRLVASDLIGEDVIRLTYVSA